MIDTQVKKHDDYSVEFKIGFITDNKLVDINEFRINTWIFIPNSLDINRDTYPKNHFYRDTKTYLRLITPIYTLKEILLHDRGPFPRLSKAIDFALQSPEDEVYENYVYQIKMLSGILKSTLRNETRQICLLTDDDVIITSVYEYIDNIRAIAKRYRSYEEILIRHDDKKLLQYFKFGDDFIGNIIEQNAFFLLRNLKKGTVYNAVKKVIIELVKEESAHKRKRGFLVIEQNNDTHNSLVITQRNVLKKFVESDLFLQTVKKEDGAVARQMYYSIAAGLAMIFATVISFFATQRYGNFTTDLFIVLVISYMMKDRIKELTRYYFSSQMSRKYFDTKTNLSVRNQEIGWVKEAFDFVSEDMMPDYIISLRNRSPLVEAENKIYDEKIIRYRKLVSLSREDIEKYKEYRLSGINDITRFNLFHYMQKMDNPVIPLYMPDDNYGYTQIEGKKVYSLFFVVQCESKEDVYYKKFRVLFNRNGIDDIREIE